MTCHKPPHRALPFPTLGPKSIAVYYLTLPKGGFHSGGTLFARVIRHFHIGAKHHEMARVLHYEIQICTMDGVVTDPVPRLVPWTQVAYARRLKT